MAKFDGRKGARVYFTYLGDGDTGLPSTLAPASDGTIWVSGTNQYGGVVTTPDALEPTLSNPFSEAAYVKHISSDGSQQLYGTYLDGFLDLAAPGVALASGSTNFFQIDNFNAPSLLPTGPLITSIVNAASLSQPAYISALGKSCLSSASLLGPNNPSLINSIPPVAFLRI